MAGAEPPAERERQLDTEAMTDAERRLLIAQLRRNWREEMSSARLYRRLAATTAEDGEPQATLLEMAGHELRHADHWGERLEELGERIPRLRPNLRDVALPLLARTAGLGAVISLIEGGEARGKFDYMRQARLLPDAKSRAIAGRIVPDERLHQGAAARLSGRRDASSAAGRPRRTYFAEYLRDLIFGLNDGLVSNLSLISGVSAAASTRVVLLAGVAGIIAGGTSMFAGSYLSNKSQREVIAEEVRRAAELIAYAPEEERDALRRIYREKGFTDEEVELLVGRICTDPDHWLDVLVTEELGLSLDPGPPPVADGAWAGGGFAIAATIPLLPFLFTSGATALVIACVLSALALFAVGAAKTLVTRRSPMRSGAEMVIVGLLASLVTFMVGRLIGGGVP
ncbi:MAG: vacuolar iron transporter family protein [Chloroflexota bacterium]|jgi:VIT1/CCC1 family predicted Fe2+/Mn2+ transporter/demethoxyubiquinone hydroxylase (CLK1/Coq7/Cat5 family)|nr:vacuolar iron transporter family protein [Chloroflexota bacterium]